MENMKILNDNLPILEDLIDFNPCSIFRAMAQIMHKKY